MRSCRVTGWLVVAAMVTTGTLTVAPGTAHACSCVELQLADYADDISVAFVGTQVERTVHSQVADKGVALVFSVDRVYKGEAGPLIEVRTHAQESACGIDMDGRGTAGVVAHEWQGDLVVDLCGSVVSVGVLEDVFGEGHPPDQSIRHSPSPGGSHGMSIVLLIAGAGMVLVVGAAAWRRRS